jgi:ABC-type lipoprotein release transport system permease subunit
VCDNLVRLEAVMRTIREILLTEYIGAILIGVLIADAIGALIITGVNQISYSMQSRHNPVLNSHRLSMTYSVLDSVVRAALFLLVAYLLARWLYPAPEASSKEVGREARTQ